MGSLLVWLGVETKSKRVLGIIKREKLGESKRHSQEALTVCVIISPGRIHLHVSAADCLLLYNLPRSLFVTVCFFTPFVDVFGHLLYLGSMEDEVAFLCARCLVIRNMGYCLNQLLCYSLFTCCGVDSLHQWLSACSSYTVEKGKLAPLVTYYHLEIPKLIAIFSYTGSSSLAS